MSMKVGSIVHNSGPMVTASTMNRNTAAPNNAPLWVLNWSQTSHHCERPEVSGFAGSSIGASVIADPRVKQAVEHVGDQVEQHDQHREDEGERLHHRQVVPRIAVISSWPMPFTLKTCSVMMAPPKIAGTPAR
jgi:hypothetical protein